MGKSFKRKIIIVDKEFQMRFTRKFVLITLLGTFISLFIILGFYYFNYKYGGKEFSRYLIEVGIDDKMNIDIQNNLGQTPLHLAALKKDNRKIITTLLDSGADVNKLDKNEKTPLDYALLTNDEEMIKELVDYGGMIGQQILSKRAGK